MKRLLIVSLVAMMALMQSCKDECKDVNCENGGSCLEGICQCADGFSGTNCETRDIDVFIGVWTGNNVCLGEEGELVSVEISEVEGSNTEVTVVVDGGDPLSSTVTDGVLNIPETTIELFGLIIVTSGNGEVISEGTLELNIDTTIDGDPFPCTFTGIM